MLSYLLIELFYIGMPVVRTDGRSGVCRSVGRSVGVRSRDYQIFLGWVDYHVSLAMGLHPRGAFRAARGAPLLSLD